MEFVSSKVMDALKNIGLNLYQRKLWVALLARGSATVGELAELTGVPRSRIYDTMQSLCDRGFVFIQHSRPVRFLAISPSEALERAKRRLEEEYKEAMEQLETFCRAAEMRELLNLYQSGLKLIKPVEFSGTIKGRNSIAKHLLNMLKSARKEVSLVSAPRGLVELLKQNCEVLKQLKERGVEIKVAIPHRDAEVIKLLGSVADIKCVGEEIPGQFCVVDGKELLLPLTDMSSLDTLQEVAIWSKSPYAAEKMFGSMFKLVWSRPKKP